jgi:hypothetical protein
MLMRDEYAYSAAIANAQTVPHAVYIKCSRRFNFVAMLSGGVQTCRGEGGGKQHDFSHVQNVPFLTTKGKKQSI